MTIYEKLKAWITRSEYLEPEKEARMWLDKKYETLIAEISGKYPEGTLTGFVSTEMTAVFKTFIKKFKKYAKDLYGRIYLCDFFNNYWKEKLKDNPNLRIIGDIDFYVDERWVVYRNACKLAWRNKVDITETFISEYISDYVKDILSKDIEEEFHKKYPNVFYEASDKAFGYNFYYQNSVYLMALKSFAGLSDAEIVTLFSEAVKANNLLVSDINRDGWDRPYLTITTNVIEETRKHR